ncbi:YggT family protein [Clostridium niameyense]|uniref:YggT family protein n=1 Tax=Clostridium niameyense TaxID=1622073 RepID=A0A6M0R817_9CLOT|nr:YggT family protein [Clostridium niameyense]NEZ46365.1 YggT family protein [Clostridium niameyense]
MLRNFLMVAFNLLFKLLEVAILIDVFISWIPMSYGKYNGFISFIRAFTKPFMEPFRKLQNRIFPNFMIDFSPIFALLLIDILRRIVYTFLY